MIEEITIYQWVSSLGFPIAVAVYHMIYQERTLRKLTEALNSLKDCIVRTHYPPPLQQVINTPHQ